VDHAACRYTDTASGGSGGGSRSGESDGGAAVTGTSFVPDDQIEMYEAFWDLVVPAGKTQLGGKAAVGFLVKSGFNKTELAAIWKIADTRKPKGMLCQQEFYVALKMIALKQASAIPLLSALFRRGFECVCVCVRVRVCARARACVCACV
jgi:hypothetical protein